MPISKLCDFQVCKCSVVSVIVWSGESQAIQLVTGLLAEWLCERLVIRTCDRASLSPASHLVAFL